MKLFWGKPELVNGKQRRRHWVKNKGIKKERGPSLKHSDSWQNDPPIGGDTDAEGLFHLSSTFGFVPTACYLLSDWIALVACSSRHECMPFRTISLFHFLFLFVNLFPPCTSGTVRIGSPRKTLRHKTINDIYGSPRSDAPWIIDRTFVLKITHHGLDRLSEALLMNGPHLLLGISHRSIRSFTFLFIFWRAHVSVEGLLEIQCSLNLLNFKPTDGCEC